MKPRYQPFHVTVLTHGRPLSEASPWFPRIIAEQYCQTHRRHASTTRRRPSPNTYIFHQSDHTIQRQQAKSAVSRHHFRPSSTTTTSPNAAETSTATDSLPKVLINDLIAQEIVIDFNDGEAVRYPSFWLRDHCPCSECTHPHTNQRQIDTFTIPPDIKATDAVPTSEGLKVTWSSESPHESLFSWSWLQQHTPFDSKPVTQHARSNWEHVSPLTTNGLPNTDFESVMKTDTGLSQFLAQIRTYGFAFIPSTPPTPEATEQLLQRIAFIRVTHYGGFWDFTTTPKPIDTAYTNLALPAHTDNTYFTDPCGLQLFHVLLPATKGGGASTLVDGFAAAKKLFTLNKEYYDILSRVRIVSHASGDPEAGNILNNALHPAGFPVFTHVAPNTALNPRNLTQIRWNNNDRHSSTRFPNHQSMRTWYAAAKLWTGILASPEFELEVQLQPGMPVIFDNWRVLHGRRAFDGQRRVCGAYIGMDDFLAKGRLVDGRVARAVEEKGAKEGVTL